jgi:hypothetical protein
MIIELISWIFIRVLMHDILTHDGFGIAGRPVACWVVSAEVRIKVMRWSDVAENDVAGDILVRTSNPNPNLCSLRSTLVNACLRIYYGLILL